MFKFNSDSHFLEQYQSELSCELNMVDLISNNFFIILLSNNKIGRSR